MPRIEIAGGPDVNVVRAGPRGGAPVVFLHALGLDLTWWDHQVEEFGRDHDVIALDLPGHGLSGRPDASPTFDLMARSVAGVLAHVGAGAAHVVGISFGGMVAQELALARPDMVRSLSLVATSCAFPEAARQAIRERARVTRAGGMAAIAPLSVERWFPPAFRARRPDVLDRAAKVLLRQDPEFHAFLWDTVAALDMERRLPSLACPAMVVAGGEDMSAPATAGQVIVDRVAAATLHVMAGCGHFPPLEAPETFNALLRGFLLAA
jgi:3-oxoadipate enol-lactonase